MPPQAPPATTSSQGRCVRECQVSTTNVEPPQRTSACATAILKAATAPVPPSRAPAYPAMPLARPGWTLTPLAQPAAIITTLVAVSYLVTCTQCREEVLEAERIGDEESAPCAIISWPPMRRRFSPGPSAC